LFFEPPPPPPPKPVPIERSPEPTPPVILKHGRQDRRTEKQIQVNLDCQLKKRFPR
jgi:hypothetical protein